MSNPNIMPGGYTAATNHWVTETLASIDLGINGPFDLITPETGFNPSNDPTGSRHVWDLLILGLGSNVNRRELTIAYGTMNNYKAKWLQGSTPASVVTNDDLNTKILIRDVRAIQPSS